MVTATTKKISTKIPGYITLYEAAKIIGVSHSQMTRYVGELLEAVLVGHQYMVKEEDVLNFQRPRRGNPDFLKQGQKAEKTRRNRKT